MSAPTVIPPRAGEVIGDSPDRRVEILGEHDGLHATRSRFGPRRDGADLHIHRRHTDLFYHAPGLGFAHYMRALRDGRTPSFDQEPPPAEGTRPATDAVIGSSVDIEAIAIAEVQSAPGEPSPVPHVHHRHVQSFYVLEGELALTAGDRELRAQAGSWVDVPSGLPHAVSSSQPVRYLDLLAPS